MGHRQATGDWSRGRPEDTRDVFERVALDDAFPPFLTLVAYDSIV